MSFQNSARNIRLEDGHILKAELADEQGDWHDAEIDLDEILGNDRGMSRVPFHILQLQNK